MNGIEEEAEPRRLIDALAKEVKTVPIFTTLDERDSEACKEWFSAI